MLTMNYYVGNGSKIFWKNCIQSKNSHVLEDKTIKSNITKEKWRCLNSDEGNLWKEETSEGKKISCANFLLLSITKAHFDLHGRCSLSHFWSLVSLIRSVQPPAASEMTSFTLQWEHLTAFKRNNKLFICHHRCQTSFNTQNDLQEKEKANLFISSVGIVGSALKWNIYTEMQKHSSVCFVIL